MASIKEESEEIKIEETFRVKYEDTEEQTGWFHSQNWTHSFESFKMSSSAEMNIFRDAPMRKFC